MITWIQPLLIVAVLLLLVYLLRSRSTAQAKAWVKLGFVVFVVAGIYAILGRGTDLMLYALIIAFAFTTLSTYLRFKDLELRYSRLTRAVALRGAEPPSGDIAPELAPEEVNGPSDPVR
ncbi:Conserved membrane protein of uncharacterised function [Mycobacteroides abscessus subsp. abscessus]|nr:Conserved membrane protein of uncharacterised function [Mycobacteroides abscessus subsp. abscessus]